jgi:Ras family
MRNVISRVKGSQPAPILLVANKLDLECQREVSTQEGKFILKINDKFDESSIPQHTILYPLPPFIVIHETRDII